MSEQPSELAVVIKSSHVGTNAEVFPLVLQLHVPLGSTVADVTFGRGTFWKYVPPDSYRLLASDLATGTDCTKLPYDSGSIDAVVLDPPYVAGFFRPHKIGENYRDFTHRYSKNFTETGPRYHAGVVDLFVRAGEEAHRVLKPQGTLIVKCQDEVHAGRQYLTHVEIVNAYHPKFYAKDIFIVTRNGGNYGVRGRAAQSKQHHARKNHSYFLVFQKQ